MLKASLVVLRDVVVVLGAVACILVWLKVEPKDVRMSAPHWVWLICAIILMLTSLGTSVHARYRLYRLEMERAKEVAERKSPPESKLKIHRARFGVEGREIDITDRLNGQVRDGIVIDVCQNVAPTDPATGVRKTLHVEYSYDGNPCSPVVRQESPPGQLPPRLVLPQDSEIARLERELSHTQAKYSSDITNALNDKARVGNKVLEFEAQQTSLLNRLTGLVHDIWVFLKEQPTHPETDDWEKLAHGTMERVQKVHSGYFLRLHKRVEEMVYELGESGFYDFSLNELVNRAAQSDHTITEIADKLLELRDKLELEQFRGQSSKKLPKLSLRDRVFDLCDELKLFLEKHGKPPNAYLIPISDQAEYERRYNSEVQPWLDKFRADYWRNYMQKVVDVRHELAMASITSEELDNRLNEAQTGSLEEVTVKEIERNLRLAAARL